MAANVPDGDDHEEIHDINVTPLIDVMLVLLIIFMVAAPLATVDLPVNLPQAAATPSERPPRPIFLTLRTDGTMALGGDVIDRAALAASLDARSGGTRTDPVYLRADRALSYGTVMALMDEVRRAGYLRISLVALQGAQ